MVATYKEKRAAGLKNKEVWPAINAALGKDWSRNKMEAAAKAARIWTQGRFLNQFPCVFIFIIRGITHGGKHRAQTVVAPRANATTTWRRRMRRTLRGVSGPSRRATPLAGLSRRRGARRRRGPLAG